MRSPLAARLSGDELGGRPRNYGHLLGLAARYARTWLDGLTVVNAETGWPIGLRWSRGLENAVAPGVPPVLLQAVPALPKMLAEGRYLGTFEDGPPRLPVRWLHSFAAAATVAGQPHEAMLIVREDPLGRLFFDGFLARGSGIAAGKTVGGRLDPRATRGHRVPRRQVGGGTPDSGDGIAAPAASTEDSVADAVAPVPNATAAASEPRFDEIGEPLPPAPPAPPNGTDTSSEPRFDDIGNPLPPAPPAPRVPVYEARPPMAGWETLPPGDARDALEHGYEPGEWRAMKRGEPWAPPQPPPLPGFWSRVSSGLSKDAEQAFGGSYGLSPETYEALGGDRAVLTRWIYAPLAKAVDALGPVRGPTFARNALTRTLAELGYSLKLSSEDPEHAKRDIDDTLALLGAAVGAHLPEAMAVPRAEALPSLDTPEAALAPAADAAPEAAADAEPSALATPKRTVYKRKYQKVFFAEHPELDGRVAVHHAIEQQAPDIYPDLISGAEMHALENLRGIPIEANDELHSSIIRKEWNQFYRENPNATREQLNQKRDEIDAKYGSQFMPPLPSGEE